MSADQVTTPTVHCDVILEQTLGHITHGQNLKRLWAMQPDFEPTFIPVEFDLDGLTRWFPGYRNWTIRAGLRARRGLRALGREHRRDALFVHSQVPAVLLGDSMSHTPTVVSLDATPKQYDELGEHYEHHTGPAQLERMKNLLNRRCFDRAAHIVTWADWTREGLIADYGVDPSKITVIPPGVDTVRWLSPPRFAEIAGPVRLLFVGGDLRRKGGGDLLAAFTLVREQLGASVELHMVTGGEVPVVDGVTVHHGMTPNSPELISLYHMCDVFCLPTHGDCLPMVLPEAGASGLALISTDVGAISEIVRDGETGLLVAPGDVRSLARAIERLVTDDELRTRMAGRVANLVRSEHDAVANAARLVEVIRAAAGVSLPARR